MTLRHQLRLATAAFLATAAVGGGLVLRSLHQAGTAREETTRVEALRRDLTELRFAGEEYLTHREPREPRAAVQFRAIHGAMDQRIAGLAASDPERRELVASLRDDHRVIGDAFDLMLTSTDRLEGAGAPERAEVRELEAILGGQILVRSQAMVSDGSRLAALAWADAETAIRRMTLTVVLSFLILALVAAATMVAISRALVRPIEALRLGTERIGGGDLSFRVGTSRDDEIGVLGRAFDAMARRLKERSDQLEATNKELESFSYSVSHDLRAPLRHVSGFIDILAREYGPGLDEQARRYMAVVTDASRKMGRLIDDLLAFSRTGRVELRRAPCRLDDLVAEAVRDLAPDLAGREVAWTIAPLPEVSADPSLLRQVFANLLGNAVKFTRARPLAHIEVGSQAGGPGEVVVFVRDDGVGFDMTYVAKLFGVFERLHPAEEYDGTGVGLANVRRIVARHGGRTWAEGAVGVGATFYFSLPAAREATWSGS
jgi:signal transduction histidine kinase